MYRVSEVAQILGVYRQTVYKRLKSHSAELAPYLSNHNNILQISPEGLEYLRGTFADKNTDVSRETLSQLHLPAEPPMTPSTKPSTPSTGPATEPPTQRPTEPQPVLQPASKAKSCTESKTELQARIQALESEYQKLQEAYQWLQEFTDTLLDQQIAGKRKETEEKNQLIASYKELLIRIQQIG